MKIDPPSREDMLAFMPATVAEMADEFDVSEKTISSKIANIRKTKGACFIACWEPDADGYYRSVWRAGKGTDASKPKRKRGRKPAAKPQAATPFSALYATPVKSRLELLRPLPRPPKKPRKPYTRRN